MSTRTDWGLFNKDGTPLAVGDEWHKWKCPQEAWATHQFVHPITGEDDEVVSVPVPCPFKHVSVKLDRCEKCGVEFRYP